MGLTNVLHDMRFFCDALAAILQYVQKNEISQSAQHQIYEEDHLFTHFNLSCQQSGG
jgi:hypothetical protein